MNQIQKPNKKKVKYASLFGAGTAVAAMGLNMSDDYHWGVYGAVGLGLLVFLVTYISWRSQQ